MKTFPSQDVSLKQRWSVAVILLLSFLARLILIVRGGQFYFVDEGRYQGSRDIANALWQGDMAGAVQSILISPAHLGFKILGVLPASVEFLLGNNNRYLPAIFFSLFSLLTLYLVYKLSLQLSVSPTEAMVALIFAAACHSLLYYARHLVPYDMAMSLGLLALYFGLAEQESIQRSLACGLFSMLCFLTYNGYWPLAGFVMVVHVLKNAKLDVSLFRKTAWTFAGFLIPFILVFLAFQALGVNLFSRYESFVQSIDQGSYAEGWSLPFEYLWQSEKVFILVIVALAVWGIVSILNGRKRHALVWAAGVLFIYLCLLVPSVLFHSFVVYGRLARQLMPFLVLLSAAGFADLRPKMGLNMQWLLIGVVLFQGVWNFTTSYRLSYPVEFVAQVQTQYRDFEIVPRWLTFRAPPVCQNHRYVIQNAKFFSSPPEDTIPVDGSLLFSAPHPVNFVPYQYEGFTASERQQFREQNIQMVFTRVSVEDAAETHPLQEPILDCTGKFK